MNFITPANPPKEGDTIELTYCNERVRVKCLSVNMNTVNMSHPWRKHTNWLQSYSWLQQRDAVIAKPSLVEFGK